MSIEALLQKLSDGQFHSGEALGEVLGVSRTAVWKQLQKLEEIGLPLESVKGRGYRLPGGLDLLSRAEILAELAPGIRERLVDIDIRREVDSTNSVVIAHAAAGGAPGYVCAAERQTAGRGRRGRPWVSPYAGNLYFSLSWRFEGGAAALEGLSLAVGVAVARALAALGVSAGLKWPNDILCGDRKIAGILLEMQGDAAGPCQVVIGVGLNVRMPEALRGQIDQPWTDLSRELSTPPSRSELLARLLERLVEMLQVFSERGFSMFREEWQELDIHRDCRVSLRVGEWRRHGIARGVDNSGALLLDTEVGREVFSGGEVSLRSPE